MHKPIIAVDIDEVLSPLHDLVFAHHNAVYGTNYPIRDHATGHYYLDQYSDESHDEIAKKIEQGVAVPKSAICKRLGATYIVEDNLGHAFECAEAGVTALLFGDYPWNQKTKLPPNVVRCKDWPAVLGYFDGVKDAQ